MGLRINYIRATAVFCAVITFFARECRASEPAQDLGSIARANNAMAFDIYGELSKRPGNLIVSPLPIETSLAASYAGAHGETANEISQVTHVSSERVNDWVPFLKQLENAGNCGSELNIGISLWIQNEYPFLKSFVELVQGRFGATVNRIDLTGWPGPFDPEKAAIARTRINRWIEAQTHGDSGDALPSTLPKANTRLILANTIYFKGAWATLFDKSQTKRYPFYVTDSVAVSAPIMHKQGNYTLREDADVKILEMPFRSNRISMVVLLPTVRDGLRNLERTLTAQYISRVPLIGKAVEVDVFLPRFSVTCEFDLKGSLEKLGMQHAFSETNADFSGITAERSFFIGSFLHSATVDVSEDGAKASAMTIDSYNTIGAPVRFMVDHPFIFLIRDDTTGAILFIGRITNPLQEH